MVEVGIHIFMAVYGLSVFMETPQHLRKGRRRYIIISFLITTLRALTGSLDMAWHFQQLFTATSTIEYYQLMMKNWRVWYRILSDVSMNVVVLIGEALLVYRCWIICVGYRWVAILPACTCVAAFVSLATLWRDTDQAASSTPAATASQLLTVSTNIIVTSLIIFHLIRARRNLAKILPLTETARLYTGVVAILIESAFPLCVLGIIAAAFEQSQDTAPATLGFTVSFYLFTGLFYSFCRKNLNSKPYYPAHPNSSVIGRDPLPQKGKEYPSIDKSPNSRAALSLVDALRTVTYKEGGRYTVIVIWSWQQAKKTDIIRLTYA
ncbi:hypothetical protein H1R20_g12306, partial [Candolleomyces eurysporus]